MPSSLPWQLSIHLTHKLFNIYFLSHKVKEISEINIELPSLEINFIQSCISNTKSIWRQNIEKFSVYITAVCRGCPKEK